jgi:hypothetical protein
MWPSRFSRLFLIVLWVIIVGIISACSSKPVINGQPKLPDGIYEVNPVFREFYAHLGGEEVLGVAISSMFENENIKYQYTENCLMEYDASRSSNQQFALAPLGSEMGISDPPITNSSLPGNRVVDGYIIYPDFVALYDSLGGARFVGRPLTQIRYNPKHERFEQYFTNLGFYQQDGNRSNQVGLLEYGAWKCDQYCRHMRDENGIISNAPSYPQPFAPITEGLGLALTGLPLGSPHKTADGYLEQVYENIVVITDPQNLQYFQLRPLPEMLGVEATPLVQQIDDPRMVFYPIEGNLGHNVPRIFVDFINQHGGLVISGTPITEIYPYEQVYRQCFKNICLDFIPGETFDQQIQPAQLGKEYYEMHQSVITQANNEVDLTHKETLRLKVWEEYPKIDSNQKQVISVQIWDENTSNPLPNFEPTLTVRLPDGTLTTYIYPPTDQKGYTTFELPPLQAKNGSMIIYKVCLNDPGNSPICVEESYIIWGNP